MHRSNRWLVLIATAALILSACGPNRDDADDQDDQPAASGQAGELEARGEIFAYGVAYETSDEVAKGRIDHFTEEYPDVQVRFSESEFDEQQFLTAARRADVVSIPRERIGSYVASGVLEPLDDCIARSGVSMDVYYPAAVEQVTVDGSVYGIPIDFLITNWLIDTDLFEEAGLDPESWDVSDWDAIAEANRTLLDAGALVGVDPKVSDEGDRFPMWVWANGGRMISEDGRESLLDTPEVVEALTFVKSIIDEYGSHADFLDDRGATGDFFSAEQLTKDTEGAWPMQQWYLNIIAGSAADTNFAAKPFLDRQGNPMTLAEGNAYAIMAESDNKDAACAFITATTSTEAWLRAAEDRAEAAEGPQTGAVAANREATEQIYEQFVDLAEQPQLDAALQVYLDSLETAFYMPTSPAAEEFRRAWIGAVTSVLNGEAEPEEALLQADEEAQAAIDSAGS